MSDRSGITESRDHLLELQEGARSASERDRIRMLLHLVDRTRPVPELASLLGRSERTLYRWLDSYRAGGLDGLLERKHQGRPSRLATFDLAEIRQRIADAGFTGVEQVRTFLEREYGIRYSRSGAWYLLREVLNARPGGWMILEDGEKPADLAEIEGSGALDRPEAVIELLNSLPMTDDVLEWGNGFRRVLHLIVPEVDRITVTVNVNCDLKRRERYSTQGTRLASVVSEESTQLPGVDATPLKKEDATPSVRILENLRQQGLPLKQFHAPVVAEYYYNEVVYIGCILLWKDVAKPPISTDAVRLLTSLQPFILYSLSDFVARYQSGKPVEGVFFDALEKMISDAGLSPAEHKIVTLQLLGHSYKEIADKVSVSLDAVKKHFHAIYRKTGTRGQAELFSKYFAAGLRQEQQAADKSGSKEP